MPQGSFGRRTVALAIGLLIAVGATDAPAATQPGGPQDTLFGFNGSADPTQYASQRQLNAPVRRVIFNWSAVQDDPDSWDWRRYDSQYDGMLDAGLRPLIVVVGSPCWARPTGCSGGWAPPDPDHDAAWGEFAGRVAARYPGAVGIEVWNEPNLKSTFGGVVDPARYTELLIAAYEGVQAARPAMPVISGGLVTRERSGLWGTADATFLSAMYAAGAGSHMDAIGIHPYPKVLENDGTWSWDPPATGEALDRARAVRDAQGESSTPLWVTEMGESTATQDGFPAAVSEEEQASDLVGLVRRVRAMPDVPVVIIHKLMDTDPSLNYAYAGIESGFGAYRLDGSPKPAACALSGELGGTLPCSTLLPRPAPSAHDDVATITEDDPATPIDVLANDAYADGGPMTIDAASDPANGSVLVADDQTTLSYVPDPDYCNDSVASETFTYTLNGGSTATVTVGVSCQTISTDITRRPDNRTTRRRARFAFDSSEADAFECRLDHKRFRRCDDPYLANVRPGGHRFRVRGVDTAGKIDRSPATFRWRVVRKRHRR